MPKDHPVILLTRPQMQAERFAQMLGNAKVVISPLMRIEMVPLALDLDMYTGLIFTSANGVHACGCHDLTAYCVGGRTAKAAKKAGMKAVSAGGSADDLVAMIGRANVGGPMLHIRGEHTTGEVSKRLRKRGLQVDDVVGYRQVAIPLSNEARKLLLGEQTVILPLFSPRSARLFFGDARQIKSPLRIVVISEAVGEMVSGEITIAKTPDAAAMAQAIKERMEA